MKLLEKQENRIKVSIQRSDFDIGFEIGLQKNGDCHTGAVVTFVGYVRDFSDTKNLKYMELEYYPGMTEKSLERICELALNKWNINTISIIHRFGLLYPGDRIVMVSVGCAHRKEALTVTDFLIDFLKSQAPFWKKETTLTGSKWVEAKKSDEMSLSRWL